MAFKKPTIVRIWGDCDDAGDLKTAGPGTTRYCVTCDAVKDDEEIKLQHPWRTLTPDEAIALVKAFHVSAYGEIRNCTAVEIPGSYQKP